MMMPCHVIVELLDKKNFSSTAWLQTWILKSKFVLGGEGQREDNLTPHLKFAI